MVRTIFPVLKVMSESMCGPYGAQWPGKLLRSPAVTQYGNKKHLLLFWFFLPLTLRLLLSNTERESEIVSYGKYCSVVKKTFLPLSQVLTCQTH